MLPTSIRPIKTWAEEDRPREKLLSKGKAVLTEAELIAILIGSGTKSTSAVELARQILGQVNQDLHQLAKFSVPELMKIKGIGQAKAIAIVSAMELGRRRSFAGFPKKTKISSSHDAFQCIKSELLDLNREEFWVIMLNRANFVVQKKLISRGGITGTVADPKLIFKAALDHFACSIILIHNHPSGNLAPSEADIHLTQKMKKAGELLEIPVLDHLIFTDQAYFSFADESLL